MSYSAKSNYSSPVIYIYNMNGNLVISKDMKNGNDTELNVSGLPTGIYILKLIDGKESLAKKIHIIHNKTN
jgi:hypothetical protein